MGLYDEADEANLDKLERRHYDYDLERDRYFEALGEDILARRDELEILEARYAKAQRWTPPPAPVDREQTTDPRVFGRGDDPGTHRDGDEQIAWPS